MYEGDTPNAERRAAALALDRDLLRELLGQEELRELIDPEALEEVERQLQQLTEIGAGQGPRRPAADAAPARRPDRGGVRGSAWPRATRRPRCWRSSSASAAPRRSGLPARSAGSPPRTPGCTATRSGCRLPPGLPESLPRAGRGRDAGPGPPLRANPRPVPDGASSRTATGSTRLPALRELERSGALVRGELLPGGTEREWCDADVLRRVRRAQPRPARARRPRPSTRPSWRASCPAGRTSTRTGPPAPGPTACARRWSPLQGVALTPEVWERDVLPRRLGAYSPNWLDQLTTGGEVVWIGAGSARPRRGRVALYFREDVRLAGPPPSNAKLEPPAGRAPRTRSASAWRSARASGSTSSPSSRRRRRSCTRRCGIWLGPGEATNDAFAPLRAPGG